MRYMAEFSRNKPLAQCVALSLPRVRFPGPEASPQQIRASCKAWRKHAAVAKRRIKKESLKDLPSGYAAQLAAITDLLDRLTPLLARGHETQPRAEFLGNCVSDLMTLGLYAPALQYQSLLLEDLAAQNDAQGASAPALALAQGHLRMAELLREQPDLSRAREQAQQARSLCAAQDGATQLAARRCALFIAEIGLYQEDVEPAFAQAAAVRRALGDEHGDDLALECRALRIQAIARAVQRDFKAALARVKAALAAGQAARLDARWATVPKLKVFAGILLRKLRQWDEAEAAFREAETELAALFAPGHLDMGRTAMEIGRFHCLKQDFDQAEASLRQALATFKPLARAHLELAIASAFQARLLRVRGKRQRAWQMVEQGLKACAKQPVAHSEWAYRIQLERAYLLFGEGQFAEAIPCLQALLARARPSARDPHSGELHLLLGRAHMARQEMPEAQAALTQALACPADPEDFPLRAHARLDLATARLGLGHHRAARRATESVLRDLDRAALDREFLRGRCAYVLGRSCRLTGDLQQADAHFQFARDRLAPDPGLAAECRLWIGDTCLEQGDHGLAIEALQGLVKDKSLKHLRREEDRIKTWYLYGLALYLAGNLEAAWKRVQTAYDGMAKCASSLRASKLPSEIRLLMGNLAAITGRHKTVVKVLGPLLAEAPARSPERLGIHGLLGQACWNLEQRKQACAHFETCLPLALELHGPQAPTTLQVREQLAYALQALDEPARAATELEALLQYAAGPAYAASKPKWTLTLAELQYRLGRLDAARRALARLPADMTPAKRTGEQRIFVRRAQLESRIERAANRPDSARRVLRQALAERLPADLDPEWADAHVMLADLDQETQAREAAVWNLRAALALYRAHDARERSIECGLQIAACLWQDGQRRDSLRELGAVLAWVEAKPDAASPNARLGLYLTQGRRLACVGRKQEALAHWRQAIRIGTGCRGSKRLPLLAQCQLEAARLETAAAAEKRYRWIQWEYKRQKRKPDKTLALSCLQYGIILWDRNELQPAFDQLQKAHALFGATADAEAPAALATRHYLALWHADAGAADEARALLQSLLAVPRRALPAALSPALLRDHLALLAPPGQFPLPFPPGA